MDEGASPLGCKPTYNYWKHNVDARNPLMLLLEITL
jgi:hypothetical protein